MSGGAGGSRRTVSLFGVRLGTDFRFENRLEEVGGEPEATFACTAAAPLELPWDDLRPVIESPDPTGGESLAALYRAGGCDVLRFRRFADFYLWPERIVCHLLDPAFAYLVEIRLLGPVFSYWLERRGVLALHASAIVAGGRTAAFLSTGGGGKTSLAAALMAAGRPLLTDDVLAVEERGGGFVAVPGYPQMRMWPEEAEHFLGRADDLGRVHPDYPKRRVPVDAGGLGSFDRRRRPVGCLYLPVRRPPGAAGGGVEIVPVSPRDAVIELVRHSFAPHVVEAAGLQPERFERIARLAEAVPVRRLLYPSGFERLPAVAAAILRDLPRPAH